MNILVSKMLAKLHWRLLTEGDKTWCKVMKAKYEVEQIGDQLHRRRKCSYIWSADLLKKGMKWFVRSGSPGLKYGRKTSPEPTHFAAPAQLNDKCLGT